MFSFCLTFSFFVSLAAAFYDQDLLARMDWKGTGAWWERMGRRREEEDACVHACRACRAVRALPCRAVRGVCGGKKKEEEEKELEEEEEEGGGGWVGG